MRRDYADPALLLERQQARSCAGCRHENEVMGRPVCALGRRHGRHCKRYEERKAMTLDERLDNWGRVVRAPRFQKGVCAQWAAWYCGIRGFVPDAEDEFNASMPPINRDERDGWDVERAWRAMSNPVTKDLLKLVYVERRSMDSLRTAMWKRHSARIRVQSFDFALLNAQRDIQRELVRLLPVANFPAWDTCKPAETVL